MKKSLEQEVISTTKGQMTPEGKAIVTQNLPKHPDNVWKKGQSGNPKGRPKKADSLTELIKQELKEHPGKARAIVNRLITMAEHGDIRAIEEILDRIDGKIIEKRPELEKAGVTIIFSPAPERERSLPSISIVEGQVIGETNGTETHTLTE